MSGNFDKATTCRRRSRKNCTTTTTPRKQCLALVTLLISCWTIHTSQAASLLNGRYETTTDVTDYLNLALDAAKMSETSDFDTTLDLYKNGAPRDSPNSVTLQSLSLKSEDEMKSNPFYQMFRFAFWDLGYNREGEDDGQFDGSRVEFYADTVVQDLFALQIKEIESDAALVMNVWMASVNGVFQAMAYCSAHDADKGLAALDRAVALWVGADQEEGSNEKGHLLYNMAENAGERFGQDSGETEVNRKVMDGFNELKTALQGGTCDKANFGVKYAALRTTVYWLTGIMTVPLVQNLIHHTIEVEDEGGSNMVELYALGIIPRVATCDPRAYENLLILDVLNDLKVKDEDMAIEALQSVYSCLGITCQDVGSYMGGEVATCQDPSSDSAFNQGGYMATSKGARSIANIDRDILNIDAFLKYEAYDLAFDWYSHGWNSELSLHTLAEHDFVPDLPDPKSSYYSMFSEYYGSSDYFGSSPDFLSEKITNILTGSDVTYQKGSASSEQIRKAATGLLQVVVVFVNIADALKYASSQCSAGDLESAKKFVDSSAMFFVGSMSNMNSNSNRSIDGKSIFVMGQDLCDDFGTCVTNGGKTGAVINDLIISSLNLVVEKLDAKDCDEVNSLIESTILPALTVPLIQGLLKQALYNEDLLVGTSDGGLATGDVLSRSILPLVNQASSESANVIKTQMGYQQTTQPVVDGFVSVADALRGDTLSDMGIACALVGVLAAEPTAGRMCADAASPTKSPTVSELGFGRYVFSNPTLANVHAKFALDVRDMFNAASTDEGSVIYKEGANAQDANIYGLADGEPLTPSLASLSLLANRVMFDDSFFNIYKYALYEDSDFESSSGETFAFANDIVTEAFGKGSDTKLAAESTVILQVFMAITNRLYSAVRICTDRKAPLLELDSAVALWLGDMQGEGKFDDGWMMYSIAQSVEKFFGYPEGESPVNSLLMNLFLQAQTAARSCEENSDSSKKLRYLSREIIRLLTQPIIQSLLFHMVKNSKNMVELYAVAAIPQCAACDNDAYETLQTSFFSGYDHETSLTNEVLDSLATFLRCQRITCENIQTGTDADEKLEILVNQLCDRLGKGSNSNLPIAGYVPEYSVNEAARLDLDALEMYIMMRTQAYGAATDIYSFGHNSGASYGATLKSLANTTNQEISADGIIMQALMQRREYATATRGQRAEIVRRTAQSVISYNSVVAKMESSIDSCNDGSLETARQEWDMAVAYFAGSMEGILAGNKAERHGVWMYALGNEFCQDFNTCETSGEANVDQQIMFDFASGRDSMVDGGCDYLTTLVSDSIKPKLLVPHIQGIISSSIKMNNDLSNNSELLATVNILSHVIIPVVEALNPGSGSYLKETFGSFSTASTSPVVSKVVEVFAEVVNKLNIPCDAIGNPSGFTLCSKNAVGPVGPGGSNGGQSGGQTGGQTGVVTEVDTPTNFVGYTPSTYVTDRANIALDIKDMSEALQEGNNELAQLIYRKGKNSEKYDENGKFVRTRTLQGFSIFATDDMRDEPEFNLFMYALQNQKYADELVEEALANSKSSNYEVATEAAMVLNLWMEIVHLMHETLQNCKNKKLRDDDGVFLMDAAVAFWIGTDQIAGDSKNGHLLYALSERFGEIFNIEDAGQSRTNGNILRLFNEAKNEVSLPNACSDSQYTYPKLRGIVNRLIPQMAIPLIQGLIMNLRANDRERVKIYSHAYVPLVAGCSPSLYESLKDKFFVNTEYNVVEVEGIIDLIRQSYDCLGLKCDDIGIPNEETTDTSPVCKDQKVVANLAGYKPIERGGLEYSRFDLDIREIDVLLQMKAYTAVDELYTYGKHVRGTNGVGVSIGQLATTKHRNIVPEFDSFVQYYDTDTFADDVIRAAIDARDNWTESQRRIVILKATQVLVMYFAALQNAYEAVEDCKAQKSQTSKDSHSWDQTAGILIGSLEGTEKNGTSEGYMFYDLAQEHCLEFGTCTVDTTGVQLNEKLISLLYTGRGAVLSGSCRAIEKVAEELSGLLLIPIVQGALSASSELTTSEDPDKRAEAYVYGRALVPFVKQRAAASDIDSYFGNSAPSDKRHTAQKLYAALATAYPRMNVDCEDIGVSNGIDTCSGVVYVSDYIWIVVGVGIGLLLVAAGFFYCRRRKKSIYSENNARSNPPRAEMNHSMDLLEKAFTNTRKNVTPESSNSDSDGETELLNKKYIDDRVEDFSNNLDRFQDEDDDHSYDEEAIALTKAPGPDII